MSTSANKRAKPVSDDTRALLAEMEQDAKPSEDKLDVARAAIAKLRALELDRIDVEAHLFDIVQEIRGVKEKTLPDVFDEAGISSLGISADGNLPPYDVRVEDYYKASIPEENRSEAFDYLRKIDQEDLIKTTFTIEFGLREAKAAERFRRSLDKAGIGFSEKSGVPWASLTAWFRQAHQKKPLPAKAMALLGATVGRVAKVVKQKEKK